MVLLILLVLRSTLGKGPRGIGHSVHMFLECKLNVFEYNYNWLMDALLRLV